MKMRAEPTILPLRLRNVSYVVRGKKLLDDVSVLFTEGKRTMILGPNGAGKSLTPAMPGLIELSGSCWLGPGRTPRFAMMSSTPVMLRRSALANLTLPWLPGVMGWQRRSGPEA